MYDRIIRGGQVIDGTGNPPFRADVAVKDGKIAFVGLLPPEAQAEEVLDAQGHYVTPGFIDAHSHGDQVLGQYPGMLAKINQGITTEIAGQCGGSMYPNG